ncbi:NUDIX hydrolase [Lipingzhangella sp. LS1_29]|uniref:NUDIX hydrolase n=1 Tax=Lipingzhangella rawalii TaxID=2055835 RepID=A0ABU2H128_9ACTN|nr:NUDIX hydrolase [Lipingzhangella rawalii]MDS1269009.1 NUDIX hydrolase [Lipingzhangella rawalii]
MNAPLPAAEWFAQLPTAYLSASGLITTPDGRVLIVDPNYREHWTLPGGVVEHGEPPHRACEREVAEEVGLDVTAGRFLACQWNGPRGERPRPFLSLVFDCGTISPDTGITLQTEELDGYDFVSPDQASTLVHPLVAPRLTAALRARTSGTVEYVVRDEPSATTRDTSPGKASVH